MLIGLALVEIVGEDDALDEAHDALDILYRREISQHGRRHHALLVVGMFCKHRHIAAQGLIDSLLFNHIWHCI